MESLTSRVLKCILEDIKEIAWCTSSSDKTINFELGQTANIPRTLSEHRLLAAVRLCLVIVSATNYIQARLVFCHQDQSKFFANNGHRYSLSSFKTLDSCSLEEHNLGCYINLCSWITILRLQNPLFLWGVLLAPNLPSWLRPLFAVGFYSEVTLSIWLLFVWFLAGH